MTSADPTGEPRDPQSVPDAGDDLVFATHDRARDRGEQGRTVDEDVTFSVAPRTREAVPQPRRPAPAVEPEVAATPAGTGAAPARAFQVTSSTPTRTARTDQVPWTVREAPASSPRVVTRRGWSARESEAVERAAKDAVRRLREAAVEVSWRSAWIAVTSASGRRRGL